MQDEYELMPRAELDALRKEVEQVKRNPLGDTQASMTLLESMNKLSASINKLNDILSGANEDMVKAYSDASGQEILRKLLEQNEKLAHGIVAVAEMVKEVQHKQEAQPVREPIREAQVEFHPEPRYEPPQPAQMPPAQQRNPFAEEYAPPTPMATPRVEQNAPGFLMHPGLKERIPENEIPPPPKRF